MLVFDNPGRIEMQVSADDPAVSTQDIANTVSKNLSGWNYPVGAKDGEAFSHLLKASVGKVTHGQTPTGFSFSAGNSDPRAIDFQKADTLPIGCVLSSIDHPEQSRELSMDFMADQSDKEYLATENLADHISTVCFNLLTEAKWPLKEKIEDQGGAIKSPGWIPEIRIEEKVTTDDPVTTPVVPPSTSTPTASPETDVKTPVPQKAINTEKPNVTIETNKPRRQIIIHNQGAPVILEFGYQRR